MKEGGRETLNLKPMRYKTYTWPHNPETYEITWERKLAVHKLPYGRYCLQDLGPGCRVMRGEGTFSGQSAYQEFQKLIGVFEEGGAGLLVHPVWRSASAHFVRLELREQPLPDYVHYAFEFWEDGGSAGGLTALSGTRTGASAVQKAGASSGSYTVRKGDTLWGIARDCGVTLQSLIAANPQIKNPNLIYPGEKVKLP